METKDLPTLKAKMDREILAIVQDFEEKSGLIISGIEFRQLVNMLGRIPTYSQLTRIMGVII